LTNNPMRRSYLNARESLPSSQLTARSVSRGMLELRWDWYSHVYSLRWERNNCQVGRIHFFFHILLNALP
jgi:hypothetical protein